MTDRTQAMTETAELLGNLPLRYIDGPDYCTVKDSTDSDFALTVQPDLLRLMEYALTESASLKANIAELEANEKAYEEIIGKKTFQEAADRIRDLEQVVGWVDSWVSNPVGAYSVHALDGLFRTTREKIEALRPTDTAP